MTDSTDYYSKITDSSSALYSEQSGVTEADLRQEFIDTLEGTATEVAKGHPALLRQFRLDSNGHKILCSCVDKTTGEPDKDTYCPISMGEKYIWDEKEVLVYSVVSGTDPALSTRETLTQAGLLNIPLVIFYLRYDTGISPEDKIVEIALDLEGSPVKPLRRIAIYRTQSLIEFRGDRGRVEYYKTACTKEYVKFLNTPSL